MSRVILFNKPYGVLCQFSAQPNRLTLKDYLPQPAIYPAGRLDADSEGLVVLTDDGALQHRISDPAHKLPKTYLAQIEGLPTPAALRTLSAGVALKGFITRKAGVRQVEEPGWIWPRSPAIRERRNIPTAWLEIVLYEGKTRQVRHMTAAVGFPTLRLIRVGVGAWTLTGMNPGEWREASVESPATKALFPVVSKRQPIRGRGVIGRAIPHSPKRKKP